MTPRTTPTLTFTGDDTDTVQTATITLTPVVNVYDGDMDPETITATLAANGVLGPSTIKAMPGFVRFMQDFAPETALYYKLRLSNRPEPGGTVRVTATATNDYYGLALTRNGAPQRSLTVTFEDREANPGCHNSGYDDYFLKNGVRTNANGQVGEDRNNTPDTAWRCYRRIWVINRTTRDRTLDDTCTDIRHTATGGGVRDVRSAPIGTIRAHVINRHDDSGCGLITGTAAAGQQAAPAPTDPVSNVQVTAVDAAKASVT